ncbi:MAG TPA: DsbA family protein [Streptosporangiaceae bacterium]|nr:DsbA family protein [Streptosporangiaceae bacterium]
MSKATRQRSARERLAQERRRQAQAAARKRALLITFSGLAVLALVVGITVFVTTRKEQRTQQATAYTGRLAPVSRNADGSITMAQAGVSAPVLEIFEDFQCPICKEVEEASGSTIKRLAAEGKVKVVYRPFQLFQDEPLASNSRRAANAALCTPAGKWISYHDTLYDFQPPEGTTGYSKKDLVAWGGDLGITDAAYTKCVNDTQKGGQVDQMTQYATGTRKVTGTPTFFLDGRQLDLQGQLLNPSGLQQAITSAGRAAPTSSGSPGTEK